MSKVRKLINDSADFAINSKEPDPDELFTDININ